MQFDYAQRMSTLFGMSVIVLLQIRADEIIRTIVLAGIGGISSYVVTLGIRFLMAYLRKRF